MQKATQLTFPSDIGQLTAEWLTSVLTLNFPGTVVTSLFVGSIIHGTATKIRLLLTYNEAGHRHRLPPTLWVKGGYEAHSNEQLLAYATETHFYHDLAGELDIGCPRAFVAYCEPNSLRSILVLEDLLARNVSFGHPSQPISIDTAARVLELHARLHARYWLGEGLQRFNWLIRGGHLLNSTVIQNLYAPAAWQRIMTLPRAEFIVGELRERERMRDVMMFMLTTDSKRAHCLVHGDPHVGNLSFDQDGKPSYLDWQTIMQGYWAHDVAYFLTSALTVADRRHGERDLLQHYLKALKEHGASAPSFNEAWLEYRRHVLYNFGWALCPPEWQPEEACYPCAERACAAIVDLDSLAAWGELL